MTKNPRHIALRLPTDAHASFVRTQTAASGLSLTEWLLNRIFTAKEEMELFAKSAKANRRSKNV